MGVSSLRRSATPWATIAALFVIVLLLIGMAVNLRNLERAKTAAESIATQLREKEQDLADQARAALLSKKRLEQARHAAEEREQTLEAGHEKQIQELTQAHRQQVAKSTHQLEAARREAQQERTRADDIARQAEEKSRKLEAENELLAGQLEELRGGMMERTDTLAMRVAQMQSELADASGLVSSSVARLEEALAARAEDAEEERRKLTVLFGQLREHVAELPDLPDPIRQRIEQMGQLYETYVAEREQVGERFAKLGQSVTETLALLIGGIADQLDQVRFELDAIEQRLNEIEAERKSLGEDDGDDPTDPQAEVRASRRAELDTQIAEARAERTRLEKRRAALTDAWPRVSNARRRLLAVLEAAGS